jgi:hypothetical protein
VTKDETLRGYLAVHNRPPAFTGADGHAYSVEIYADDIPGEDGRYGAAVLFVRWSASRGGPDNHLETEYLSFGDSPAQAGEAIESLTLYELKDHLDRVIRNHKEILDW